MKSVVQGVAPVWRRLSAVWLALAASATLSGCMTMDMSIAPEAGSPARPADAPPKIAGTVGYFIATQDRANVVRSTNGRVAYHPYRDLEPGLKQMLGNVFEGVVRLDSPTDIGVIRGSGVRSIVEPRLSIRIGGSPQLLPQSASLDVELTNTVRCPFSDIVASTQASAQSTTQGAELAIDVGAPGRRAMDEALARSQAALFALRLDDPSRYRCPAIF